MEYHGAGQLRLPPAPLSAYSLLQFLEHWFDINLQQQGSFANPLAGGSLRGSPAAGIKGGVGLTGDRNGLLERHGQRTEAPTKWMLG